MTRVSKQKRTAETVRTIQRKHKGQALCEKQIRTYLSQSCNPCEIDSGGITRAWEFINQVGGITKIQGYDDKYEVTDIDPNTIIKMDMAKVVNLNQALTFDDIIVAPTSTQIENARTSLLKEMKIATAKMKVTQDLDALEVANKIIKHLFKN